MSTLPGLGFQPGATESAASNATPSFGSIWPQPHTAGASSTVASARPGWVAFSTSATAPPMLSPMTISRWPGWRARSCVAMSAASATMRSVPAQAPRSGDAPKPRWSGANTA